MTNRWNVANLSPAAMSTESPQDTVSQDRYSFRARFCKAFNCAEIDFERRALRRLLHWPWCLAAPWVYRLRLVSPVSDLEIIRVIGAATARSDVKREVLDIREDYRRRGDFNFARHRLRFRLSGKRVLATARLLWREDNASGS